MEKTISVGGIQVPAPETQAPENQQKYYTPYVYGIYDTDDYFHEDNFWDDDKYDYQMLKRGFVHLNKYAAIAHAKALIALTALPD